MADWTAKELDLLKRQYGTMPNRELAKMMGRSKQSLQWKAYELKMTAPKVATWKYCVDCGAKLSRAAIYKKKANRCYPCSMKKHSGSGHHNWKGGVASLRSLVHILLKPVWIDPILKRDDYTCRFCGKRGGDMEVHHIYSYRKIRDEVIKANPTVNLRTFEGKKEIALKIVMAHKLAYGITLCVTCHAEVTYEKRGELLETPERDNQQPSLPNLKVLVGGKVQRLTGEDSETDKPDTSAPHESNDSRRYSLSLQETVRSKA